MIHVAIASMNELNDDYLYAYSVDKDEMKLTCKVDGVPVRSFTLPLAVTFYHSGKVIFDFDKAKADVKSSISIMGCWLRSIASGYGDKNPWEINAMIGW